MSYVDPLPDLIKSLKSQRKLDVRIETMDLCGGVTALAFMPISQQVVIRVQKQLSFCVKRFAILKELLHYVKDGLASKETTESSLDTSIIAAIECRSQLAAPDRPLHPEAFCYYCAIETLLWWGNRGIVRSKLTDMHQSRTPDMVMACAYRVPLYVIQFFFEDNSRYSGLSYLLNKQIA